MGQDTYHGDTDSDSINHFKPHCKHNEHIFFNNNS
jgi:hypothetical protein